MEELKTKPIVEESLEKETKTDIVDNEIIIDFQDLVKYLIL